jgi:hypothetical protein
MCQSFLFLDELCYTYALPSLQPILPASNRRFEGITTWLMTLMLDKELHTSISIQVMVYELFFQRLT